MNTKIAIAAIALTLGACNQMSNSEALLSAGVASPYDHTGFNVMGGPVIVAKDGTQIACGPTHCRKVNPLAGAVE